MKQFALSLLVLSAMTAASAQTSVKPGAPKATARPAGSSASAGGVKLPPGIPQGHGLVKTAFCLRYQDLKIGTGAVAEPYQLYKVHYTGWLASNGHKFDSSYDHPAPVFDKDGKPGLDAEGRPKMGEPRPLQFPQGFGKLIPGFDQGLAGMRVGGKRRLFIPWQLAYGVRGRPGAIPEKSDLIFDIELIDQSDLDMQMPMGHPGMAQPGRVNPAGQATPAPSESQSSPGSNSGAPSPGGTPPPSTPPSSAPPAEKPQAK